jgi:exosortase
MNGETRLSARLNGPAWLLGIACAWLWTWKHLALEWSANPQYHYGFGVPILFVVALWKRWPGPLAPTRPGVASLCILILAWLAFSLGELLRWHDPVWRLTGGFLALGTTLLTAVWLHRAGGGPLLKRALFPLALAWLALPWPVPVELRITQQLLHFVTAITIALANLIGIAAIQHGNTVELANGTFGMDDACSGIRSLQAAVMASLFLGELLRLTPRLRGALLLGGVAFSILGNVARVLALMLVFHSGGENVESHWHNFAGGLASLLTFAAIGVLAIRLAPPTTTESGTRIRVSILPGFDGIVIAFAILATPLLARTWFHHLQIPAESQPRTAHWTIDPNRLPSGWDSEIVQPNDTARTALRYSGWNAFRFRSPRGWSAQIVHLTWAPGTSLPGMAFYHTPAMCLPWSGWSESVPAKAATLVVRGEPLPCVVYRFRQGNEATVVIQSLSNGGATGHHFVDPALIGGRGRRLATLWKAPLRQVNEELLVYLPDFGSADLQSEAFGELLDHVLGPNRP